jgi:hypothetical protein
MPDRTRKTQVFVEVVRISPTTPVPKAIPQAKTKITVTRIAVARLELISRTPILANNAVNDAKTADKIAHSFQPIT